jgi:hypothetical protein
VQENKSILGKSVLVRPIRPVNSSLILSLT